MSEKCPECGENYIVYAGVGLPCLNCMYVPDKNEYDDIKEMCWEQDKDHSCCCIKRLEDSK